MIMNLCKYNIDDLNIIFRDGSKETIPKNNIINLLIDKTYDENFFPIMCMKAVVTKKTYNKIIKNSETVLFNIKIEKFLVKNNVTQITKTNSKIVLDEFLSLATSDTEITEYSIENQNTELKSSPEKDSMEVNFFLFNNSHLERYKKRFNFIAQEATVANVLVYAASQCGMKMLFSPPDNNSKNQIIITPYTFIGLVEYLQKVYGVYNHGYMLFNDYDVVYLLNNIGKCTALRYNEVQRVYIGIGEIDSASNANIGCYYDKQNDLYKINLQKKPMIMNNEKEIKETIDNVSFIDTKNKSSISKKSTDTKSDAIIMDNRYGNDYSVNEYNNQLKTSKTILHATMIDTEFDILTPNKEYYINLDDNVSIKKYTNLYKLKRVVINLYKEKNEFFNSIIECDFNNV